jgi:rhamnosyltransferase
MAQATIVVLSAGRRESLSSVLGATLAMEPKASGVQLIWSGAESIPLDVPADVACVTIDPATFDHGGTRQLALDRCPTQFLVLLTDDALPAAPHWLAAILRPFADERMLAVYGRQVPRAEAGVAEQAFRMARYPEHSFSLSLDDLDSRATVLPISDANAAYRVDGLRSLGGFPVPCRSGEDYVVASRALRAGWRVAYAADAVVWHSHDLKWLALLGRGWAVGAIAKAEDVRQTETHRAGGRGGAVLARAMFRIGWQRSGMRGVVAVAWAVFLRAAGYVAGRVFATSRFSARPSE